MVYTETSIVMCLNALRRNNTDYLEAVNKKKTENFTPSRRERFNRLVTEIDALVRNTVIPSVQDMLYDDI